MKEYYIDIAGKWKIILCFDISLLDLDAIADYLDALGCDDKQIRRACRTILKNNTGFTYSNEKLKMSLMCIGNASDVSQWWDTVAHEIDHVQDKICRVYGCRLGTEAAAHLQGYIMRMLIRAI